MSIAIEKTKKTMKVDLNDTIFTSSILKSDIRNLEGIKVALQIHIYYLETIDVIKACLQNIIVSFDCYISTDSFEKKQIILDKLKDVVNGNLIIDVFKNKGRDVMPFLVQMRNHYQKYDYICHFHSKKTVNSLYGDGWRDYLYRNLFGNYKNVNSILTLFETETKIGIIYPYTYPIIKKQVEWGGNKFQTRRLMKKIGVSGRLKREAEFPAGNMFWVRSSAVKKMFDYPWSEDDFPEEKGQINKTVMHCIERIWNYVCYDAGYYEKKIFNSCCSNMKKKRLLICAITTGGKMDVQTCSEVYSSISPEVRYVEYTYMNDNEKVSCEKQSVLAWKNYILNNEDIIKEFEEVCLVSNVFCCKARDISYLNDYFYLRDRDVSYLNVSGRQIKCGMILFKRSVCKSQDFFECWRRLDHYKYQCLIEKISNTYGGIDIIVGENYSFYNSLEEYKGTQYYDFFQYILGNPFIDDEENGCGK